MGPGLSPGGKLRSHKCAWLGKKKKKEEGRKGQRERKRWEGERKKEEGRKERKGREGR